MMTNELKSLEDFPDMDFKNSTLRIGESPGGKNGNSPNVNSGLNGTWNGQSSLDSDGAHTAANNAVNVTALEKSRNDTALVPWWSDNVEDFFTNRKGLIESAIEDCKNVLLSSSDGDFVGAWLLTQISSWDTEKERLIILTARSIFTVKYDFIALKLLEHEKVELEKIDTIIIGGLIYPQSSLVPRINGFLDGVSAVVKGCVLQPLQERLASSPQNIVKINPFESANFEPRSRNINGVRAMWNNGQPLSAVKKWNPFTKIPWTTFTSHPLSYHKMWPTADNTRDIFSVDNFTEKLVETVEAITLRPNPCNIEREPILLENYVGLGSLIHNKNALGFFKVRGKFSF
ncbi:tumor protein p63-regulated gene 1-like protein [Nilaparvata lugens]|uniref:tumor protein p63-regulated gene 1-like protein n=1 Tax=Nilaparvata lugens TaxID=108931 RepID=UPI000B98F9B3|nr:tumor protein p63-regulated gene 1-like protein [Nilaparvata lugens]